MGYATTEEIKAFAQNPDMTDNVLYLLIGPVSEAIDAWCRRSFAPVTRSVALNYQASTLLRVEREIVSVTEITTNAGQTFTDADVVLEPTSGPPYRWIRMKGGRSLQYVDDPLGAITVTGVWGYGLTVPARVQLACMTWVAKLYTLSDVQGVENVQGAGSRASFVTLPAEPPDDIKALLRGLQAVRVERL